MLRRLVTSSLGVDSLLSMFVRSILFLFYEIFCRRKLLIQSRASGLLLSICSASGLVCVVLLLNQEDLECMSVSLLLWVFTLNSAWVLMFNENLMKIILMKQEKDCLRWNCSSVTISLCLCSSWVVWFLCLHQIHRISVSVMCLLLLCHLDHRLWRTFNHVLE